MNLPNRIGGYQVEAHLGSGEHAEVYRANDTIRKRIVALKVLKPGRIPDAQAFSRFEKELQPATDLVHPHIAWVWEAGEADGFIFICERYVESRSLDQILAQDGPLSWETALQWLKQTGQALDFAHSKGQVHGDLKPRNILFSQQAGVVLTDFGLWKALRNSGSLPYEAPPATPHYTAPEVWNGQPPHRGSDQYALACILVEMLTGNPLFDGPTPSDIMIRHIEPWALPENWPPDVPGELQDVLQRAMAEEPSRRYPSISMLAAQAESSVNEARARRSAEELAREAEEKEKRRQAAEEAVRLEAIEVARREIEASLRPPDGQSEAGAAAAAGSATVVESAAAAASAAPEAPPEAPEGEPGPEADEDRSASSAAVFAAEPLTTPAAGPALDTKEWQTSPRRGLSSGLIFGLVGLLILALLGGILWQQGAFQAGGSTATPPANSTSETASQDPNPVLAGAASHTPTLSPTRTASPSPQPSTTQTRPPSRTPTARPSATPTPYVPVELTSTAGFRLRTGPGTNFPIIRNYETGTTVTVLAQGPNGEWLLVRTQDQKQGWVIASALEPTPDLEAIPTIESTPTLPATRQPTAETIEEEEEPRPPRETDISRS